MVLLPKIFSLSSLATVVTFGYVGLALTNLYRLMYPLHGVDTESFPSHQLVRPLWSSSSSSSSSSAATASPLSMKVYLSSSDRFGLDFLRADDDSDSSAPSASGIDSRSSAVLLWEEDVPPTLSTLSASFVVTDGCSSVRSCEGRGGDGGGGSSFEKASEFLDAAETKYDLERGFGSGKDGGGIVHLLSAHAGEGIESTSVLLSLYNALGDALEKAAEMIRGGGADGDEDAVAKKEADAGKGGRKKGRTVVPVPPSSPIWKALRSNSTVHAHVLLTRSSSTTSSSKSSPPSSSVSEEDDRERTFQLAARDLQRSFASHDAILGSVGMVKYDAPHHVLKPTRMLYRDILYVLRKYVLFSVSDGEAAPWDASAHKPAQHEAYVEARKMKEDGVGYPYWKPEVAVKFVGDTSAFPIHLVGNSGMEVVQLRRGNGALSKAQQREHPSGYAYLPGLHVDEIGLTSEKYVPVNGTLRALPLHVTFDRNDVVVPADDGEHGETSAAASGASAGGLSPARWRLLSHFSRALESQKEMGFDESDIDDVRRLIADTNVILLAVTMLASTLHLLFEFLTFKNDVEFWRGNSDLTGLSVRALFMDFGSQAIILLYLVEKDSSLLMTVPSGMGVLIALWKCQRGAGFKFVKVMRGADGGSKSGGVAFYNRLFRVFGYELHATRLRVSETSDTKQEDGKKEKEGTGGKATGSGSGETESKEEGEKAPRVDLVALSIETDRLATRTLGYYVLLPLVLSYTIRSLVVEEHPGWYSWLITSASSAVYALGFVMMTPQLFLNYKLKSVAHLPWRVLCYRFINTFIDDLFAFIIRMPTMARISCFRDDVVFVIYLWQRYLYPVDASRPVEGGGMDALSAAANTEKSASAKKVKNEDADAADEMKKKKKNQ